MTVSSFDLPTTYTGSGTTGPFATGFYFLEDSHLLITKLEIATGTETTLELNSDYTVSGAGDPSGGDITLTSSLSSDYKLIIDLDIPYTQETDYQEGDAFPAESHETALDKVTMLAKQNSIRSNRAIRTPNDETTTVLLPRAEDRANKALIFDADGNVTVSTDDYEDQVQAVSDLADDAADSATAALASQTAAATSETNAAASASNAAASAAKLSGTSASSVLIATGSKSFTTQASKFFDVGNYVMISSGADPSNYMHGQVTAYSGTSLTVNVTNIGGSGTFADWTIAVSGTRGATGATGPTGPAGSGSGDMLKANNLSDLTSASTARTNLGLGTIATQNSNGVSITGGSVTGITDLAVADGGTGASDAATARTNLGLGNAATLTAGTSANNLVQLDGSAKLPAVDGSQLTNLPSASGSGRLLNVDRYGCASNTFTVTIASPAVFTINGSAEYRRPSNGSPVRLTTTGALPTGLATNTTYYVVESGVAGAGKFKLSATKGGTAINTSGSQSGTHTINSAPYVKATNSPTFVEIEVIGGGGGAGSGNGGGGGSGGYAYKKVAASSLSSSETVSVGNGGAANSSGGSSSFFSMSVGGGSSGGSTSPYQGGAGGTADTSGVSDFTFDGQTGGLGSTTGWGNGGTIIGSGPGSGAGGNPTNTTGYCGCVIIREYS